MRNALEQLSTMSTALVAAAGWLAVDMSGASGPGRPLKLVGLLTCLFAGVALMLYRRVCETHWLRADRGFAIRQSLFESRNASDSEPARHFVSPFDDSQALDAVLTIVAESFSETVLEMARIVERAERVGRSFSKTNLR